MSRVVGIVAILLAVALVVNRWFPLSDVLHTSAEGTSIECPIKGNISLNGERIYHVPDGKWYDKTTIDTLKGERWFCSEEEARAAGWRRSYE